MVDDPPPPPPPSPPDDDASPTSITQVPLGNSGDRGVASAVPIEPLPPGPNDSSITLGGAPPTAPLPPLPSPSPGGGDSGGEYDGASDADMEEFEAVIEGRIEENGPLGLMLCDTRSPAGYSHVHVNSVTPDGEAARAVAEAQDEDPAADTAALIRTALRKLAPAG